MAFEARRTSTVGHLRSYPASAPVSQVTTWVPSHSGDQAAFLGWPFGEALADFDSRHRLTGSAYDELNWILRESINWIAERTRNSTIRRIVAGWPHGSTRRAHELGLKAEDS